MESEKIGRYQLLELIGRGAIGDVYRAHDPDLDREVAVKIITRSTSMDSAEVQRRFRREVQLAAYLKHPNIISVYDVGLDQEQPYLVTELLAGGTLKDYFGLGLLVWEEALALLEPISSALGYAHEVGIIHRDVKPGNIMFADDGTRTIKLADFGLAHRQDDDQLTQSGGIVGTIAYMSPEQANGEALDARTDIYSLGLILFEAIAGYNPLRGETVSRTLLNAISFDPIDLSGLLDKVPRDVLALLGSALARDRRTRYGSCRQLSQDIARCLALNEQPLPGGSKIARDLLADVSGTSRTVQIENVLGLSLPADADEILTEMFADYRRVSIKEELGGGFSGSRIFVVRPVRKDLAPDLPAVIKMAPLRLIEQEWQAYQSHIKDRLSGVTDISGAPVFPVGANWGGLRYQLVGSGDFDYDSLGQAYFKTTADDLRFILEERLFKRLAALWRFNYPTIAFPLAASYDHLLPVNLIIRPGEKQSDATIPVIRAGDLAIPKLVPGDPVRLAGFFVSEIDEANEIITLDWPSNDERLPGSYRVRLQAMNDLEGIQVDLLIDSIEGVVTSTRRELLRSEILKTLGPHFDSAAETLSLPGGRKLPNPLSRMPAILAATPTVRLANIHGDLNPENVLVDRVTRDVRLIDFATARRDHVLHDFLRLETSTVTRLLSLTMKAASLPPETITDFYQQVHCATFGRPRQSSPPLRHASLEKPFEMLVALRNAAQDYFFDPADWREYYQGLVLYLMGSLKYKNLGETAKKVAFFGAATALQFLEESPLCLEELKPAKKDALVSPVVAPKDLLDSPAGDETIPEKEEAPIVEAMPSKGLDGEQGGNEAGITGWLRENWLPSLLVTALLVVILASAIPGIRDRIVKIFDEPSDTPTPGAVLADNPAQSATTALVTPSPSVTTPPTLSPTKVRTPPVSPYPTFPAIDVFPGDLTVAILLDTSKSMNDLNKISKGIDGVITFIERLDAGDEVAVYKFGDGLLKPEPSGRVEDVRVDLIQVVSNWYADGDTQLFDALCQAAADLAERQAGAHGEERQYRIVLLTDGGDSGTGAITTDDEVFACLNEAREQTKFQIIVLAFGSEGDDDLLERLVEGNRGRYLRTTPDNVLEQLTTLTFEP